MKILGISAFYHDSAAAIIENGVVAAAAQEERFTRVKQDASFPKNAIAFCLQESKVKLNDLEAVVFYDKPFLKFERLLETYTSFAPKGLTSFIKAMPVWLKEKMFLKKLIYDELKEIEEYDKNKLTLLFPEHHLSHAASAFYTTNFNDAAILTIDGVGEWATASICHGKGKEITILKEMKFPHSVGLLYSSFTYFLGFKVNSGEYKLMGLAPYGNANSLRVKEFVEIIKEKLVKIYDDGSIWLNQEYFNYATGLKMVYDHKWENLFGFSKRKREEDIKQWHCDLALAIQIVTEEIVLKLAKKAKEVTESKKLCMAGGVALNCVANGKLQEEKIFDEIYIQPASGDAGGAIGAALAAYHIYFEKERVDNLLKKNLMKGSYLGPEYKDDDIEKVIKKYNAKCEKIDSFEQLSFIVAEHISNEKIVGWFQGKMEFGPRALGNRSIIADPRSDESQKKVNLKIKYRESFRPFAPSVLEEEKKEYFEMDEDSPYMLMVHPVKKERRKELPVDYEKYTLAEKLYFSRSDIPAITHVDFSARIQTVSKDTNPRYHQLISDFKKITGVGLVVNTSFNVRGEPIVCTPEDAYICFMRTELDYLVINNYVFSKLEQPEWREKNNWKENIVLD